MLMVHALLMLTLGVSWLPARAADAIVPGDEPVVVTIHEIQDLAEGEVKVLAWVRQGDADGTGAHVVVDLSVVGEGDVLASGPDGGIKVLTLRHLGGGVEPGGPWVGIQFGPVPKSLMAHLKLDEGVGQMVTNVIEDSPADEAGLAQYDVILQIDGEDVSSETGEFLDQVRELAPDETYVFGLMRNGRRTEVDVTVGRRPDSPEQGIYKFEGLRELEELSEGRTLHRGGMLERAEDGRWQFSPFDHKKLPNVWKMFPRPEDFAFEFEWTDDEDWPHAKRNIFMLKHHEGLGLKIVRTDDVIKVTRTEKNADGEKTTTTKTYSSEEEFEEDDPEAYKFMEGSGETCVEIGSHGGAKIYATPHLGAGLEFLKHFPKHLDLDLDLSEIMKDSEEARKHIKEIHGKLLKELRAKGLGLGKDFLFHMKPRTSFDVSPDGEVRVTRRQGGEELVERFSNAEALKEKRPDLYRKFRKLQDPEAKTKQ